MVTPARQKPNHLSARTAGRLVGLSRTADRSQHHPDQDHARRAQVQALATEYPRDGYL